MSFPRWSTRVPARSAVSDVALLALVTALVLCGRPGSARAQTTTLAEPAGRHGHTVIFDSARQRFILFGGLEQLSGARFNDVWARPLADSGAWVPLTAGGVAPAARSHHSAVYDSLANRMLIFGGLGPDRLNDVWELRLGGPSPEWNPLSPTGVPPSPRSGHSAVFHPVRNRMIVFGGEAPSFTNVTWFLELGVSPPAWQQADVGTSPRPSPRKDQVAILDLARDRMVVFGGYGVSYFDDVWTLSLDPRPTWESRLSYSGPSARGGAGALLDRVANRMLVYGGRSSAVVYDELWQLNLSSFIWSQMIPLSEAPSARTAPALAFDPVSRTGLLHGGAHAILGSSSETWKLALAPTSWKILAAPSPPPPGSPGAPSPRVIFELEGEVPSAALGQCVASIGDFNGDGTPDFAIGMPSSGPVSSDSTGRVLVYFGSLRPSAAPDLVLEGPARGSMFGAAVDCASDFNGDGFDDLLVTAPRFRYSTTSGSGRAYVYYGGIAPATEPVVTFDSPLQIYRSIRESGFGANACGLGDVNGDGFGDLAVVFETPNSDVSFGGTLIFTGGRSPSLAPFLRLENPVRGVPVPLAPGDLDDDGFADLIVASPDYSTRFTTRCQINLYDRLRSSGERRTLATSPAPGFGASLAMTRLEVEGVPLVLVGHPYGTGGGTAYLLHPGSGSLSPLPVEAPPDSFGASVAAGDVDGDGIDDLLVGAPGSDLGGAGSGIVSIYRYAPFGLMATTVGAPGDYQGYDVAVAGDLDRNGGSEILIGSPFGSGGAARGGRAQLVSFADHALLEPSGAAEWRAGREAIVRWRGEALASIELSRDQGATWTTLADPVGGAAENEARITVPATPGRARLRLSPSGAAVGSQLANTCPIWIAAEASAWTASPVVREEHRGPTGVRRFGSSLSAGGDVDANGIPDAAIGAPASGTVVVRRGGASAPAELVFHERRPGERFGASVSIDADVNRDGRADVLIGAPGNDEAGKGSGRAYLHLQGPESPPLILGGGQELESFGASVLLLDDFDGDGCGDFAVGSPGYRSTPSSPSSGRVRIWLGGAQPDATPDLTLDAPAGSSGFGTALTAADLNGDRRSDLVVTAPSVHGGLPDRVFVYLGRFVPAGGATSLVTPDLVLRAERAGDGFGASLAPAGDPNGDGIADLLVGAPAAPNAHGGYGRAYLYAGGTPPAAVPIRIFEGGAGNEMFGAAVGGAGDVNRDGRDDLAIGAPEALAGAGTVRVFFGGSDGIADLEWAGTRSGASFGGVLAGGGDSDANGRSELFAAAPYFEAPGSSGSGSVSRLEAPRHRIDAPAPRTTWFAGGLQTIRWSGAEPATLELSVDDGRSWNVLAEHAGGAATGNTFELRVTPVVEDSVWIRIRPSRAELPSESSLAGPLVIGQAMHLSRFDFELGEDGIHLEWSAEPGIGAQGLRGYRLYRVSGSSEAPIGDGLIETDSYVVPDFERGSTYVLRAVDGNGIEAELGRLTIPIVADRFRVWPVPTRGPGNVELSVFPPVDGSGRSAPDFTVRAYDMSGRLVRQLTSTGPTRVGEVRVSWDRRSADGEIVPPGVYFLRAAAPSRGFRIDRRVVLLR